MSVFRIARQLFLALVVILGLTLVPVGTANAASGTCDAPGYIKPNGGAASGTTTQPWGTVTWGDHSIAYTVNDGWTIGLCYKAGTAVDETTVTGAATGTWTVPIQQGISHIGYKVIVTPPVVPVAAPAVPVVNPPTCAAPGSYTLPTDTSVIDWQISPAYTGPGSYTVKAVLVNKATTKWADTNTTADKSWPITVLAQGSGLDCRTPVSIPAAPTAGNPTCANAGTFTLPTDTNVIDWQITPAYSAGDSGAYVVSAVLKDTTTTKWTDGTTAPKTFDLTIRPAGYNLDCRTQVNVPATPTAVPPTCVDNGSYALPDDTTAIAWSISPTYHGVGTYIVTATLKDTTKTKWNDGTTAAKTWTVNVLSKGTGQTCVQIPAQPDVNPPSCATNGSFSLPADTTAIHWTTTYNGTPGTYTVTAALKQAGAHWVDDSTSNKSWNITVLPKGSGLTCVAVPGTPTVAPPTCNTDGSYSLPDDTTAIAWTTNYQGTPGTYTVTATLRQAGAHWNDDSTAAKTWNITVRRAGYGLTCVAIPADQSAQAPTCAKDGSYALPLDTTAIDWAITPAYTGPGTYTVTASLLQAGAKWMDNTTAAKSWTVTVLGKASGLNCVTIPAQPQVAPQTCAANGSFTLPDDTDAIAWTTDYAGAPGSYTVTATLKQAGAHWADDTTAAKSWGILVLAKGFGLTCVSIPDQPQVNPPTCAADGSFTLPTDTDAIDWATTYTGHPGTYTVTAALLQAGSHWTDGSAATKSWDITVLPQGSGLTCVTIPGTPTVTPPSCSSAGSYSLPDDTDAIDWSTTYQGTPGTYTVTAALKQAGAHWTDGSAADRTWNITVRPAGYGLTCVAIPADQSAQAPTCAEDGSYALPVDTTAIDWAISPAYKGPGTYTVTASLLQDGAKWMDNTTAAKSWSVTVLSKTSGLNCVSIPAQPDVAAPTCAEDGSFTRPVDTDAIHWATTYDGKPGTYTVTAWLLQDDASWVDDTKAPKSWDITVLAKGTGLTCVPIPAQPAVVPPTCATDGSFSLPDDTDAIDWATTYDGTPGTSTVTATLKQAGAHWLDDTTAAKSFTIQVLGKGTGLTCVAIPTQPQVAPPTCATDGSFSLPADTDAIDWATTYNGFPGTSTVTATLKQEGAHWVDGSAAAKSWDITVLGKGTGLNCVSIPAQPQPVAPTCAKDGSFTLPASTDSVAWSIEPEYAGPGVYTVTASLVQDGAHWVDDSTAAKTWVVTVLAKGTGGQDCVSNPDAPSVEAPSCEGAGSYTLPASTEDVAWSIDPEYTGVGDYTVTATLVKDGAHWADDTTAPKSWDISVVDLTDSEYFDECATAQPQAEQRVVPQTEESCELGGIHTWNDVYTTPYVWDAVSRTWVLGQETGPVSQDDAFTAYTAEQATAQGCVEVEGEQGHQGHHHPPADHTPTAPEVKGEQATVPTVVEAGVAGTKGQQDQTPGRNPLWLMVIGAGLGMVVLGRRRKNSL